MRIVYTSILSPWDHRHGGGQRAVDELARAMARRGHDVEVVYSGASPPRGLDPCYPVHVVAHHERLYLNALQFARVVRGLRIEHGIVHVNGYEGALVRSVLPGQVAVVATSHHPDPACLLDEPLAPRWIARARWTRRNIVPLMERRALRGAVLVTSPSAFGAGTLRERGYLGGGRRIEIVPYGIPPLPPPSGVARGVELVCVARLDHHKGIDVLLQAMARLPGSRLDLVGTGPEEGALRRIADELGLNGRVRFRGHLDRPAVAAALAGAVALVLPSRSDNLPFVIFEAMQAGVPIVASEVGGIPEQVANETQALLVPPEDPDSLARALARVTGDGALRDRLRAAALTRAATFTWHRAAERYEELYASLRDERTGERRFGEGTVTPPASSRGNLFSSMAYVGSINVVAFLAGVIRQKVFAVYLSPRGLGGFSLAASFFELFTILAGLGASVGLLREFTRSLAGGQPDRAARAFRDVQRIVVVVALLLGAGMTVLAPVIATRLFASALPWWTVPVLVAAAPLVLANELRHAAINGLGRTGVLAASSITTVLLSLIAAVWLVARLELAGAILQLLAGAGIGFAVSQRFLARIFQVHAHEPERVPGDEARRMAVGAFRVGAATALQHLAVTANLFVFRSLVVARLGPAANGLYHATMALSRQYTAAVLAGVFVYLYPRLAELSGRPAAFSRELSRSSGFALALVVPMSLALLASRDWLVRLVFTSEFAPMVPLLAYSLSGDVLVILAGVFRIALLASGRARSFVMVGLLEEGLYLVAFLGGLHLWGLVGAAQAYIAAGALGIALYGIALWRHGELALPARRLLQMSLVLPALGLVTMGPVGRDGSRALALALGLGWLALWRREVVAGLRS